MSKEIQLFEVVFDTDLRGPGSNRQTQLTSQFARVKQAHGAPNIEIVHVVELDRVELRALEKDVERPVVFVPWSRVRSCLPFDAYAQKLEAKIVAERRVRELPPSPKPAA